MGGLNKSARTAFEEPIGLTRGEQDLPWDTLSVARPHRRCLLEIRDFHRARVCVKGAVGSSMCDPAISVTVRIRSVCGWFDAGRPRNGSGCVGDGRKFVKIERLPQEKLATASRV